MVSPKIDNANGTISFGVGIPISDPLAFVTTATTMATLTFQAVGTSGTSQVSYDISTIVAAFGETGNVIIDMDQANITLEQVVSSAETHRFVKRWGSCGSGDGQFAAMPPFSLAVDLDVVTAE